MGLGRSHGTRCHGQVRHNLSLDSLIQLGAGHTPGDNAEIQRFGCIEQPRRHENASRLALAHARNDVGTDGRRDQPQTGFGQPEPRRLVGDHAVADASQPDATTHGRAMDASDQRLRHLVQGI